MKNIIVLISILLFTSAEAKIVNGIALIVNGEAITTAEIQAIQKQMHLKKIEATNILIQDRLQKAAMRNIYIPDELIDSKIKQIALQNNISIKKMQKILKEQGTSWKKYRKSIKERMKKNKFYREKIASTLIKPSDSELKLFYQKNKKDFMIPIEIKLIEYSSLSKESIKQFLQNKKRKDIKSHSLIKYTKDLNSELLKTILSIPNGSFTPYFNDGNKFITYKIISKHGHKPISLKKSKDIIIDRWIQEQQAKTLKDYFKKLKTDANIQILR